MSDNKARPIYVARGALNLAQTALGIGPAGQPVIGAAQERDAILDRAEYGAGSLLPLLGGMTKPAVVREVNQEIGIRADMLARLLGEHVFKANEHGHFG